MFWNEIEARHARAQSAAFDFSPGLRNRHVAGRSSENAEHDPVAVFLHSDAFFSDDLSSGYDEILQVVPQGKDVCIRVIRISLANRSCGGQLVRAVERILQSTKVRKVTGSVDLCSHAETEVAAALKDAERKGIASIEDWASQNKEVRQFAGHAILGHAAIEAAKKWQFSSETLATQPVEAALKFTLCAGESSQKPE